jgi:hypothetical protein
MERSEEMRHRIEEMLKDAEEYLEQGYKYGDEFLITTAKAKINLLTELLNSGEVNQWISVEERLPESDYDVLIHTEGYTVIGRYVTIFPDKKPKWYHNGYELKSVNHWMPLPSAPSKGERE